MKFNTSPKLMRQIILQQSKRANVGHIGSCLCIVEILSALYGGVMRVASPSHPDRDRFVLSKGHGGLALYAALKLRGWISESDLDSFCGPGSYFGVHPESEAPGIDFSTGSLGHGLSLAAGSALAARMQQSGRRAFCLISDGECNEGSIWEAAMFAAHHKLNNLTAIIDINGQQAFGLTREVLNISNLKDRWTAFGWDAIEVDGHSLVELSKVLDAPPQIGDPPRVILAKTRFGRGVSYMEEGTPVSQTHLKRSTINWHYLPMSDEEYRIAMSEIEASE